MAAFCSTTTTISRQVPAAALPLPWRTPTERLTHAREDHERCLRIAAALRARMARGERGLRDQFDWALGHARTLRLRFAGMLSVAVA